MSEAAETAVAETEITSTVEDGAEGGDSTPPGTPSESSPTAEEEKKDPAAEEVKSRFKLVEAAKRQQLANVQLKREAEKALERASYAERELQARHEQLNAREARIAKLEKVIQDRDIDGLKEFGFDYVDLTKDHLRRGTPEYALEQANKRIEALEKKLTDESAQKDSQRKFQEQVEETRREAQKLVKFVEDAEVEFPELNEWPPERIAQEGIHVRDAFFRQIGRMPSYNEVISHLDARAKKEAEVRAARLQKRQGLVSSEPKQGTPGQQATTATGAPTLSNRDAATRATPAKPMTEAEKDEWAVSQLRIALGSKGKT